jgi:hypothetical protein
MVTLRCVTISQRHQGADFLSPDVLLPPLLPLLPAQQFHGHPREAASQVTCLPAAAATALCASGEET